MVKGLRINRSFDVCCPLCGTEIHVELIEADESDGSGPWSGTGECRVCGALVELTDHRSHEEVASMDEPDGGGRPVDMGVGFSFGVDVTTDG